jgi:hypothetical protein
MNEKDEKESNPIIVLEDPPPPPHPPTLSVEHKKQADPVNRMGTGENDDIEENVDDSDTFDYKIKPALYGLNEQNFNTDYNVYKLNPFSVSYVGNHISIRSNVGYFDIAFSPNLIKALGYIPLKKFSYEALQQRIKLRGLLGFGDDYSDNYLLDTIFQEIVLRTEKFFFSNENILARYTMYDKARINPIVINKAIKEGELGDLKSYISTFILPKEEYMTVRESIFKNNDISLIDAIIYRLYNDSLLKGVIGNDAINTQPSDLAFFYTDIIEPDYVDNAKMKLLDIMPIRSVGLGEKAQIELSNTRYKRVEVNILTEIQIIIKTSLGLPVPFRYGPATVQLHFRRR